MSHEKYMAVIGLEIHAELKTDSKLFCRCANTSSELQTPPNTAICPVCTGLPGALPVINKEAVLATVKLGKSLECQIPKVSKWDRKNYFYPDLPKSYQISQYDEPLCAGGEVRWFDRAGEEHRVAITRIHLEEDTGKLTHPAGTKYSLIDYNRSSIPLLELVTEPVIHSASEAKQFAEEYQLRLRELGVAEASMEKGQMRCEANISVIPKEFNTDAKKRLSGTKVEVKNLNSFRSLERAIAYEFERQIAALESGEKLTQETRGWNEAKGETYPMRSKETADDYRYFPDPDLLPLDVARLTKDVEITVHPNRYDLFRGLKEQGVKPEQLFTVVNDPERRTLLENAIDDLQSTESQILFVQWVYQEPRLIQHDAKDVAVLINQLADKKITASVVKQVIESAEPGELAKGIASITAEDSSLDIASVIATVLKENSAEVTRYKAGEEKLFGFFLGQVRKATQGKGDPAALAAELKAQLQ